MLKKIENHPGMEKDTTTNAIVNTDYALYQSRLKQREVATQNNQKIASMQYEIQNLKQLTQELSTLLREIKQHG